MDTHFLFGISDSGVRIVLPTSVVCVKKNIFNCILIN